MNPKGDRIPHDSESQWGQERAPFLLHHPLGGPYDMPLEGQVPLEYPPDLSLGSIGSPERDPHPRDWGILHTPNSGLDSQRQNTEQVFYGSHPFTHITEDTGDVSDQFIRDSNLESVGDYATHYDVNQDIMAPSHVQGSGSSANYEDPFGETTSYGVHSDNYDGPLDQGLVDPAHCVGGWANPSTSRFPGIGASATASSFTGIGASAIASSFTGIGAGATAASSFLGGGFSTRPCGWNLFDLSNKGQAVEGKVFCLRTGYQLKKYEYPPQNDPAMEKRCEAAFNEKCKRDEKKANHESMKKELEAVLRETSVLEKDKETIEQKVQGLRYQLQRIALTNTQRNESRGDAKSTYPQ